MKGGQRMRDLDEKRLIHQSLQGNDEAFYELISNYHTTVERFASQIGVHVNDLPDVTQEVFIKVYRFLNRYSYGKFSTWLYSVTLNVCKDFFRKQKRERSKINKMKMETTEGFYSFYDRLSEEASLLHEHILKMDEKYRVPIVLFYFHDLTISEIAKIIGMSENSVKTRLKRGKERLRMALEEGGQTDGFKSF